MISASDRFIRSLKEGFEFTVLIDILREDQVIYEGLEVTQGDIKQDRSSEVRRTTNLTLHDPTGTLVPKSAQDLIWPNGNEVRVKWGMVFPDETEFVTIGTFRIARPKFQDTGDDFTISLEGFDRSRTIKRNRFSEPYVVPGGSNVAENIATLIQDRFPFTLDFSQFMETDHWNNGLTFDEQEDPWAKAQNMAESMGADLYFDGMGRPVLTPEPNLDKADVVWEFIEGQDFTLTNIERDLDDEKTYNHVIVTGESTDNEEARRAEAMDDNPASPTYVESPYGRVTYFQSSEYIATDAQAQDAADAALQRVLGSTEQVGWSNIPNPLLEVNDVTRLIRQRLKINNRHAVDSLTLPLDGSLMSGKTRERRLYV